jgi:circadian clock protein KaiB
MKNTRTPDAQGDSSNASCSMILFVAGQEANSRLARQNLARICETAPEGRYEVRVVDVMDDFQAAAEHNILLIPALLRIRPKPVVTLLGNLNNHDKVRMALDMGRYPAVYGHSQRKPVVPSAGISEE